MNRLINPVRLGVVPAALFGLLACSGGTDPKPPRGGSPGNQGGTGGDVSGGGGGTGGSGLGGSGGGSGGSMGGGGTGGAGTGGRPEATVARDRVARAERLTRGPTAPPPAATPAARVARAAEARGGAGPGRTGGPRPPARATTPPRPRPDQEAALRADHPDGPAGRDRLEPGRRLPGGITEMKFVPGTTDEFFLLRKAGGIFHYKLAGNTATLLGTHVPRCGRGQQPGGLRPHLHGLRPGLRHQQVRLLRPLHRAPGARRKISRYTYDGSQLTDRRGHPRHPGARRGQLLALGGLDGLRQGQEPLGAPRRVQHRRPGPGRDTQPGQAAPPGPRPPARHGRGHARAREPDRRTPPSTPAASARPGAAPITRARAGTSSATSGRGPGARGGQRPHPARPELRLADRHLQRRQRRLLAHRLADKPGLDDLSDQYEGRAGRSVWVSPPYGDCGNDRYEGSLTGVVLVGDFFTGWVVGMHLDDAGKKAKDARLGDLHHDLVLDPGPRRLPLRHQVRPLPPGRRGREPGRPGPLPNPGDALTGAPRKNS